MADLSSVKAITDRLENGVKDLFESDKYAAYLQTMSRFHRYSTRNTLLIHLQLPTATRVAGYQDWKNKFKRQVKKGEHGIKILAPTPIVTKKELEKIDPETQRPIIGEDGQPIREEVEIRMARFKAVSVFDLSQTEGEPLPELAENITGDVARYELFMDALRAVSPLPIRFENLPPDTDGTCYFGYRITIREGMSEVQTVSAAIHEITHAKLHDIKTLTDNGEKPKDRRTEEVEAESVSYSICQFYGIETGANSFGYIADWSKTKELQELNASLDTIRKTAAELIDGIDEQYRTLARERGIDLTVEVSAVERMEVPAQNPEAASPTPETASSPEAPPETHAPTEAAIPDYAAIPTSSYAVGTNVLMSPVFDDGNFNRSDRKIRVTVEEPAGKYQLFSRNEGDNNALYFLTASGRIDRTQEYFRDEWEEQQHKWLNHRPTEAELDAVIPQIAERFEKDMADPAKWVKYQHAAVLNRLAECEAHNAPVRMLRTEEEKARHEVAEQERQEEQRRIQEKYDARVDEIAAAIQNGKTILVGYNEYAFDSKNPVLDLFKLYGIDLPLRTQGWVNTGLAEITESGYRYYKSRHKGDSTAFSGYLAKLREAIKVMPIGELRRQGQITTDTEVKNKLEHALYEKLAGMFPDFMNRKYSYLRLESPGFEPLSLEWIFGDRISIMHTFTQNGDLCYDPMIEFSVNSDRQILMATAFEQSIPPLYQYHDEQGVGRSVDGNGNARTVKNLRSELHEFSVQWFQNISEQGYMPVKANLVLGEDNEVQITFDKDGNPIMPPSEPEPSKGEAPGLPLPDPTQTIAEMNQYGYTAPDMFPISVEAAAKLFDEGHPIYLLYPDNTEALVFDRDEIITFGSEGFCGITKADWERSPMLAAQTATAAHDGDSREADLLYGGENKFGIYQILSGMDEARDFRFASMRELEAHGLSADRANYELVYTGKLDIHDTLTNLNRIYADFQGENPQRPADYAARSVSVSDVIVLQWRGEVSAHFVDSIGFKKLPVFTGNEHKQEQTAEQTAPQTESTFSQVGKSSPEHTAGAKSPQPPLSKGKPSLLARLADTKKLVEQNRQTAAATNKKERGYE